MAFLPRPLARIHPPPSSGGNIIPPVPRSVLALFARTPEPGRVKTRLSPPLTPEQASELYAAMLLDILDQHGERDDRELVLWHTPAAGADWFRQHAPGRYGLRPQRGADLASRMAHSFEAHAGEGFERIVLRGTDSPTLPAGRIDEAFEVLSGADLVLGPDRDGGYGLIGLRGGVDFGGLFDLETGHSEVFAQTLRQARAAGLRTAQLATHHDVDTVRDLVLLRRELRGAVLARAPRTGRWLRAHPGAGGASPRSDSIEP